MTEKEDFERALDEMLTGPAPLTGHTMESFFNQLGTAAQEEDVMSANDTQHGGSHYKGKAIQPWDYIMANNLGYLEGNVVKYVSRWKDKGGVEDLRKARHYLDKLIELQITENGNDNATK